MKKSHIFHVDSLSILDKMTNEQAGEFIKSAYYYMVYGELPTCSFAIEMALAPFVNQWCRDAEKWTAVREKRIEAGAKGGKQKLANASKSKQETLVNVNVNDNVNVSVNVNENVNIPFGDFWDLYAKKRGEKGKLEIKWNKLADDERVKIMEYIPRYIKSQPDNKYRKDPSTFLNKRAWEDEIIGEIKIVEKPVKVLRQMDFFNYSDYVLACQEIGITPKPAEKW